MTDCVIEAKRDVGHSGFPAKQSIYVKAVYFYAHVMSATSFPSFVFIKKLRILYISYWTNRTYICFKNC